jgi:general secretion pathway protein A
MYNEFFGFREPPFSIAPDPRYLYLSERHREALAHLMYGVQGQGGFIVITGEVGTGKTTLCRGFIENVPEHVDIAMILNPRLSARELLSSICDELGLRHPAGSTIKRLIDLINHELLEAHAAGRHKVLIIDEAQNLSADVLEQLRLLTNLETSEKKLLQIVLLGQPELRTILAQPELRQLAQRVTARYHLNAIGRSELPAYLRYRLHVAGQQSEFFDTSALNTLYRRSGGIPRVINLICDRALLGAYAESTRQIRSRHIKQAAREVLGEARQSQQGRSGAGMRATAVVATVALVVTLSWGLYERKDTLWFADAGVTPESEQPLTNGPKQESRGPSQPEAFQQTTVTSDNQVPGPKDDADATSDPGVDKRLAGSGDESLQPDDQKAVVSGIGIDTPTADTGASVLNEVSNSDWLENAGNSGTSKREAYRSLLAEWGFDYDASSSPYACDFAETVGLRCLHRQGNWRSLENMNRPTILKLFDDAGNVRYVTLTGLDDDRATIFYSGTSYELARSAIDQHWLGDYSLVWRVPAYDSRLVPDDQSVSKEAWLSSKLMQLIANKEQDAAKQDELMAASLDEQVRWFQGTKSLVQDGIVGAKTLIGMNRELYPSVPTLAPRGKQTAEVR